MYYVFTNTHHTSTINHPVSIHSGQCPQSAARPSSSPRYEPLLPYRRFGASPCGRAGHLYGFVYLQPRAACPLFPPASLAPSPSGGRPFPCMILSPFCAAIMIVKLCRRPFLPERESFHFYGISSGFISEVPGLRLQIKLLMECVAPIL